VSVVDNQALLQLDVKGTLRQTSVVGHRAAKGETAIETNQEWHEAPRREVYFRRGAIKPQGGWAGKYWHSSTEDQSVPRWMAL